ncbi:unnamed protein product [Moneuplotes crassus]|uniref:Uncharacterized protein n=1 Tax=Euplotes crassus TaxID=5936 RepID=A0AAD1UI35_EUPCR|nr:unnamed protein product [Moneuplotes crassus]
MEKKQRNLSQISKDLYRINEAYRVTQELERISEIHPNNDPQLAVCLELKKCPGEGFRKCLAKKRNFHDRSTANSEKKAIISQKIINSFHCDDNRGVTSRDENNFETLQSNPDLGELIHKLDGRHGETPTASQSQTSIFNYLEANDNLKGTPYSRFKQEISFSSKSNENHQTKISKLEKENEALRQENYQIKCLYEDRLQELNWYYQKYGQRAKGLSEETTKDTEGQYNDQPAPSTLKEISFNIPKTQEIKANSSSKAGIHQQINTLQSRIAQANERLNEKQKFKDYCYNESISTMKHLEKNRQSILDEENSLSLFKKSHQDSKSYERVSHRSKNISSTPTLLSKESKRKCKKKTQKYQQMFAENYFKSNRPLKVNNILAPPMVFKDYDLNLE